MGCFSSKTTKDPQNGTKLAKNEEITTSTADIRKVYKFDKSVVGHGHFGTVRIASLRTNPSIKFAVKTIAKEKIKKELHLLTRELDIIKQIDHPNLIKFYETYQDERFFHLVMEYCSGGELLERIIEKGHLSESETAMIMQKALSAVKHLHHYQIVHRDLKPENFLFASKDHGAEIKIIDFGLSKKFGGKDGSLKTVVGTALYVAPEVLKGSYNEKCDEWSLGVIMFILLSGSPPFEGANNNEIFAKIQACKYNLTGEDWINISKEGKDLVSKLLEPDPSKRLAASKALDHPWFKIQLEKNITQKQEGEVDPKVLKMLRTHRTESKLRKEAMKVMLNFLSDEEIKNLKEAFRKLDKDQSGMITLKDLQQAMQKLGYNDTEKEIAKVIERVHNEDNDKPVIRYQEFLSATLDSKIYLTKERLWAVFKHFDVDNSNYITAENLKEAFARAGRKLPDQEFHEMIKEADFANDGKVSFEEFMRMMHIDEPPSA